jgi:hypothetical protein
MRLTWPDLLVENITPEECRRWIEPWSGLVSGRFAPVFLNKFGSWFLRRPEGHIDHLDVFLGTLTKIADSYEDFFAEVNEVWWQEHYLLSELVWLLHQQNKIPGAGQCYALAPHPALGGPNPMTGAQVDLRFVSVIDILVWLSICAESVGMTG